MTDEELKAIRERNENRKLILTDGDDWRPGAVRDVLTDVDLLLDEIARRDEIAENEVPCECGGQRW